MAEDRAPSGNERNKELLQSYYEQVFNDHNMSAIDKYVDINITEHNPTLAPEVEKFKQVYRTYFEEFPDSQTTIEHILGEGDKVVVFSLTNATQKGDFMGNPPSNKAIQLGTADLYRMNENGKIVEHWDIVDKTDFLRTMGLIKFTQ